LNKKDIPYVLSDNCKEFVDNILEKDNLFQEAFNNGQSFKNGLYSHTEFNKYRDFLKKHIHRELKDHQVKASFHLSLVNNGANFSVPGSGKTTVVLSVYEKLRLEKKVNTLLVIGPPSCFGPWKNEYELVLNKKPSTKILAGGEKNQRTKNYYSTKNISDLYLTTFHTLLNDQDDVCAFLGNKNIHAFLVIDEAHYIKQLNGNWAKAVLKIANYSKCRCILTGTPMPKSYTDLFNLFDFLWPENNPIDSRERAKLIRHEKSNDHTSANSVLEETISPLFYRVRKLELHLKPQIFHEPEVINMNPHEKKIYEAIVRKIGSYAQKDYLKNIDVITRLQKGRMIRLRQCFSYCKLIRTAIDDYEEDIIMDNKDLKSIISNYDNIEVPAKIDKLLSMVDNFLKEHEKIVIWAHFIDTITLIENQLKKKGIYCKKIIGETPIERTGIEEEDTREKILSEFIDPNSTLNVLLANPAACAESISLHKTCHHSIYYDLSYNCAQYLQSLDRIHRVGGSENVEAHYYFLQYAETKEDDILKNLQQKAQKMYGVIEQDYSIYSLDMFDDQNEDVEAYKRIFSGVENEVNI
ncbi:DEAD/DEAH box helicase, partial [Candidatus Margulisiibacteriota bacterium]